MAGGVARRLFSGWSFTLKKTEEVKKGAFDDTLHLIGTMTKEDGKSTNFNHLGPALESNIGKYFRHFSLQDVAAQKRIVASTSVSFSEIVSGRGDIGAPIESITLSVGYPFFNQPLDANNNPNLSFQPTIEVQTAEGEFKKAMTATWTANNAKDKFILRHERLTNPLPNWKIEQAKIVAKIVFKPDDGRVDLKNNKKTFESEIMTEGGDYNVSGEEVGHIFVRFISFPIPPAMSMELICTLG